MTTAAARPGVLVRREQTIPPVWAVAITRAACRAVRLPVVTRRRATTGRSRRERSASRDSSAAHSMTTTTGLPSDWQRIYPAGLGSSPPRQPSPRAPWVKTPHHWTLPQVGEDRGHLLAGVQPTPSRPLVSEPVGSPLAFRRRRASSKAGQLPAVQHKSSSRIRVGHLPSGTRP